MDLNYFYSAMLSLTSAWQLLPFVDYNTSNTHAITRPVRLLKLVHDRRPAVACSTIDKKLRRRSTDHDRLLNGSVTSTNYQLTSIFAQQLYCCKLQTVEISVIGQTYNYTTMVVSLVDIGRNGIMTTSDFPNSKFLTTSDFFPTKVAEGRLPTGR